MDQSGILQRFLIELILRVDFADGLPTRPSPSSFPPTNQLRIVPFAGFVHRRLIGSHFRHTSAFGSTRKSSCWASAK
jgi:hypothetical protein